MDPVASEGGMGREVEDSKSDSPEFMASLCELLLANKLPALSLIFFICQMGIIGSMSRSRPEAPER